MCVDERCGVLRRGVRPSPLVIAAAAAGHVVLPCREFSAEQQQQQFVYVDVVVVSALQSRRGTLPA